MFIYHFNRLIRNRILWLIFASIVAFAFLSVDSCRYEGRDGERNAGTLGGKPVSTEAYTLAELFVNGGQRSQDIEPALVETQVWQHLAAMHTATRMGITATKEEVRDNIRATPGFQSAQGVFDGELFQRIVQSSGFAVDLYQELVRRQIIMAKLGTLISTAALISPMEIDEQASAWTDSFTIQYATISNQFANADLPLGDEQLRSFYAANKDRFRKPDMVAVHYASLAVTNFSPHVKIPDDEVEEYYDSNLSDYQRPGTNDTMVTLPLEYVRKDIVALLALDEARYMAGTNMAAFMEDLRMRDVDTDKFGWRSRARNMQVGTTELFDANAYLPGIEFAAQDEFRETAFDLDPESRENRYGIAIGEKYVYLMMTATNSPAYTPSFDELKREIRPLVLAEERAKAFENYCEQERGRVADSIAAGADWPETLGNVSTSITFTVQTVSEAILPYANDIIPAIIRLDVGELSETIYAGNGAVLAKIIDRTEGDPLSSQLVRPQILNAMSDRREGTVINAWMRWNLEQVGFQSSRLAHSYEDDDYDDE